jgi:RNA polymerase sigma factor (sigma-70 family)
MLSNQRRTTKESRLFVENQRLVHFTIAKYFSSFLSEKEDLFQVGCIGLLDSIKTYNPEIASFSTWAVINIKREIFHYLRKQYKTNYKQKINFVQLNEAFVDKKCVDLDLIDLLNAIAELPEPYRTIITKFDSNGIRYAKISLDMGYPISTIKRKRQEGINKLKELLLEKKQIPNIKLTEKEKQVLFYVSRGLTNLQIGAKLGVSKRTIETHLRNIFVKTKAKNRIQAVNAAM